MIRLLALACLLAGCAPQDYAPAGPSGNADGGGAWMCARDCNAEDELVRASAERLCDCEAYR